MGVQFPHSEPTYPQSHLLLDLGFKTLPDTKGEASDLITDELRKRKFEGVRCLPLNDAEESHTFFGDEDPFSEWDD